MSDPRAPRLTPGCPDRSSRRARAFREPPEGSGFICLDEKHVFELPEVPGGATFPNCTLSARVLLSDPFVYVFIHEQRGVVVEVEAYETRDGAKARLDRFCVEHRIPKDREGEWGFGEEGEDRATIWNVPLHQGFLLR